ncbi:hypothetical protein SAMN04488034_101457 [Salinimicrobium catena]|uniref:Uncharacterized protein n=1 Tax=Salinimicrobium catena TaxID=390640 RepID=A0A1H5IKF4_9FLAO|nr:hypothetical protein SAMN04488140_101457 [Salinimicrobium catena]SEE40709.1 hypothetical protein SAMN04488034_101457 [Salinimicrobium catena]
MKFGIILLIAHTNYFTRVSNFLSAIFGKVFRPEIWIVNNQKRESFQRNKFTFRYEQLLRNS